MKNSSSGGTPFSGGHGESIGGAALTPQMHKASGKAPLPVFTKTGRKIPSHNKGGTNTGTRQDVAKKALKLARQGHVAGPTVPAHAMADKALDRHNAKSPYC